MNKESKECPTCKRLEGELVTLEANALEALKKRPTEEEWDMLVESDCSSKEYVDELIQFIQSQGQELWDKWCARKGGDGCFNCKNRTTMGKDNLLRCKENDRFALDCTAKNLKY